MIHFTSHSSDIQWREYSRKNSDCYICLIVRKISDEKFASFTLDKIEPDPLGATGFPLPCYIFLSLLPTERAGNSTVRKRDDSCPMETDSTMSSRNQNGSMTSRDDTCGRDYFDRHFDRVTRLAAVRLSEPAVHRTRDIPSGNAKTHPPSLPPLSLSLYRKRDRNQILIDRNLILRCFISLIWGKLLVGTINLKHVEYFPVFRELLGYSNDFQNFGYPNIQIVFLVFSDTRIPGY